MSHRNVERNREPFGKSRSIFCGCGALSGESQRQPDDHFEALEFGHYRNDPCDVTLTSCDSLDRGREHAVKVTTGDADTHCADVDPEANA